MIASLAAARLDAASRDKKAPALAQLNDILPSRAMQRDRRVVIANEAGLIVAGFPQGAPTGVTLADWLGPTQPLTAFAERAGVMRISTPGGDDVLATVRGLQAPLGQVAILQPVSSALADWRSATMRNARASSSVLACIKSLRRATAACALSTRTVPPSAMLRRQPFSSCVIESA